MSAADSFALQNSMIREDTSPDFTSKQWSFMNDQNQSNYSTGQLIFDLSGFYNSQRFINLSEMFLVIPLVTVLSADDYYKAASGQSFTKGIRDGLGNPYKDAAASSFYKQQQVQYTPTDLFAIGFKSGYWNLIRSMSVNVDGKDIVQVTPNLNYYCSFIANTKWSQSDVAKHGPMCGFLPDDCLSWGVNPSKCGGKNGYGCFNNTLPSDFVPTDQSQNTASSAVTGTAGKIYRAPGVMSHKIPPNYALYKRMLCINTYQRAAGSLSETVNNKLQPLYDSKSVIQSDDFTKVALSDGCYVINEGDDDSCNKSGRVWMTTAIIRFKDICDLFAKLPLTRSLYIRLLINLNIGHMSIYQPNAVPFVSAADTDTTIIYPAKDLATAVGDLKCAPTFSSFMKSLAPNTVAWGSQCQLNTVSGGDYSYWKRADSTPSSGFAPCYRNPNGSLLVDQTDYGASSGAVAAGLRFLEQPEVCETSQIAQGTHGTGDPSGIVGPTNLPAGAPGTAAAPSQLTYGYGHIFENTFQGTCPLMLAKCVSSLWDSGARLPRADSGMQMMEVDVNPGLNCGTYSQYRNVIRLSISVCKPESSYHSPISSAVSAYQSGLQSCRVYAPSIEMNPEKALRYLEDHKIQEVRYNDVLAMTLLGVAPNSMINYFIANGIANAKRLIVIPFFHDDSVPTTAGVTTGSTLTYKQWKSGMVAPDYWNLSCSAMPFQPTSPFDSAPATTAPMGYISNFNVLLANSNIFQRNLDYDFENFLEECSECNAINGGLDTGLTSGLIDLEKWRNNYRYYVANLSRRLAGDSAPKSITLQGKNDTKFTMDLYIFVEYERKLSLNVDTGAVSL